MTYKILRSSLQNPDAMAPIVQRYIDERNAWEKHAENVNRAPDEFVPYPPPSAPEMVLRSVKETITAEGKKEFIPDFEIVDVMPIEDGDLSALEKKKNELHQEISRLEISTRNLIMTPGKIALLEAQKELAIQESVPLRTKDIIAKQEEKADRNADHLTDDEAEELAKHDDVYNRYSALQKKFLLIRIYYAGLHAEVDDLNFSNINGWTPTAMKIEDLPK